MGRREEWSDETVENERDELRTSARVKVPELEDVGDRSVGCERVEM
jgi:hypothetical protein